MTEILEGKPSDVETKALVTQFQEMEKSQLTFLDETGKRLIELTTAVLGLLFAVIAFGDKFPPAYLQGNNTAKALLMVSIGFYVLAMLVALVAIQPRAYTYNRHEAASMKATLDGIRHYKMRRLSLAGGVFLLGSVALGALIGSIVLAI